MIMSSDSVSLYNLRQSHVAWFLKNQIQHYRAFDETEYPHHERPHDLATFLPQGQPSHQHPTQREENLAMSESRL